MKSKLILVFLSASIIVFNACKKEDEEVVIPKTTFADISKITTVSCVPCHFPNSGANFEARKKFADNYTIAKDLAATMLDRMKRDPTATGFMPRGKSKLTDEEIALFQKWINDGLLEK